MFKAKRLKKLIRKDKNPDPLFHFQQEDSEERIRSVLRQNPAILEDADVIDSLLTAGNLDGFKKGEELIVENAQDDDVFFILAGEVEIQTDGQRVATRTAPIQVGEMAAMHPGEKRSATVTARSHTVATLRIPGAEFHEIMDAFPKFRDRLHVDVSKRFRQRISAGKISQKRSAFGWLFISVPVAIVSFLVVFVYCLNASFTFMEATLVSLAFGLFVFVIVTLWNPDLIYRNTFRLASLGVVGLSLYGSMSWVLSVDGSTQHIPFLLDFNSGGEMKAGVLAVAVVGLLILAIISAVADVRMRDKK